MSAPVERLRGWVGCESYAYTNQRGACGAAGGTAVRLLTITYAERRTQRLRLCNLHADGVYKDLKDPLLAHLGCTGVTETPIGTPSD
ncbi:hypothetical protein [Streptomyces sp. NPDC048191]|uniref:hypothetical protein n=1 Tax=Streptomyces sp. NPDC048191 TaxID=3155484 RepID=UPI0033E172DE